MILIVAEHDRGTLAPATLEALTFGRDLAASCGATVEAVTIGVDADDLAPTLGEYGATAVHRVHHPVLTDYGPEAWGAALDAAVRELAPTVVLATGTDRGNETLAHLAARQDRPFAANCLRVEPGPPWSVLRVRWGGSLHEEATVEDPTLVASVAHHTVEAEPAAAPLGEGRVFTPELAGTAGRSMVVERVEREAGITLATAPVVVGGGRGVGSPEGFESLERLAALLGGVVGCSRAVTNNGWRNHTDQVGQTGTRIAPDVYFACGISGAVQHWVGAMASKTIIAVNTDAEANMVAKAQYAVIGDLHDVVPAIAAEIERRRTG